MAFSKQKAELTNQLCFFICLLIFVRVFGDVLQFAA